MERLRRKLFKLKKPSKSTTASKIIDNEEIYLAPAYDETKHMSTHFDAIAAELLAMAKKSVRREKEIIYF
jgi:hypothetical protein